MRYIADANPLYPESIQKLFDQGVTEVYIHSGRVDQMRVINFYANEVLPQLEPLRDA